MQKRKPLGFTLIELVVVLGVSALIAAILMPVITSARERAKLAGCTNNLRQIGLAMTMYATDHDRFLPPYGLNEGTLLPNGTTRAAPAQDKALLACIYPYAHSEAILFCPAIPVGSTWRQTHPDFVGTYIYHGQFFSKHKKMLLEEYVGDPVFNTIYGTDPYLLTEGCSPNYEGNPPNNYSHSGRANALYRDGHIALYPIHTSTYDYPDPW